MGVGFGVLSERARIFVGLDLGQSQDPSALAVDLQTGGRHPIDHLSRIEPGRHCDIRLMHLARPQVP